MSDSRRAMSTLNRSIRLVFTAVAVAATLAGCTSNPRPGASESFAVALPRDRGRIVFFNDRPTTLSVVIPKVHFSGQSIGSCRPGSAFFVDVAPGAYDAHTSNKTAHDEKTKPPSLSIVVAAGEETFVRCRIRQGVPLGKSGAFFGDGTLDIVAADDGRAKSRNLSFSRPASQFASAHEPESL